MNKKLILPFLVLALLFITACNITLNVPTTKTTATQTATINEAAPDSKVPPQVSIEMGGGKLNVMPGATNLVEGTVEYNVAEWKPQVIRNGNLLRITQGDSGQISIPNLEVVNDWKLKLGSGPMDLSIKAGGYQGSLDLSGIALTNLNITDGASTTKLIFNNPNPSKMDRFQYSTGASTVDLNGLENVNFKEMDFSAGAGNYNLYFNGPVNQPCTVHISGGASNMTIHLPASMKVKVVVNGGISNISPHGTWTINSNEYTSDGTSPLLEIQIDTVVGSVTLDKQQ
jgi:hypothetical protein